MSARLIMAVLGFAVLAALVWAFSARAPEVEAAADDRTVPVADAP